ncbi:MAG: hypothetical protein ACJAZS_000669 [Alteromonas naphthalenivorans]|jgi:hypothetical protein
MKKFTLLATLLLSASIYSSDSHLEKIRFALWDGGRNTNETYEGLLKLSPADAQELNPNDVDRFLNKRLRLISKDESDSSIPSSPTTSLKEYEGMPYNSYRAPSPKSPK